MKRCLALLCLILPTTAWSTSRHCPVVAELYGEISGSGISAGRVEVTWRVREDATIREYRLSRHDCARPKSCSVPVATVLPAAPSPAGQSRTYTVADVPRPGLWIYRLTLVRSGAPGCREETSVVVPPPSCDMSLVCTQVEASFFGEIIISGITVGWSTTAESAASGYRLSRFDLGNPGEPSEVAVLAATGSCGQMIERSLHESAPPGEWGYRLEVFDHAGAVSCHVETVPQRR